MFRQFLRRQRRIRKGVVATYVQRRGHEYDAAGWFDAFYGTDDAATIGPGVDPLRAMYHYASVELLILRHLHNRGVSIQGRRVLDVGSGAGHWIDFYRRAGAAHCTGLEVAPRAAEHLTQKYAGDPAVAIRAGSALEVLREHEHEHERFVLVNAIGVMFHIVDDREWRATLEQIAAHLEPDGVLVVGGHFGRINGVNVQIDRSGAINKRLRSGAVWRRTLGELGFNSVAIHRNRAYLSFDGSLPESNVLVAHRA